MPYGDPTTWQALIGRTDPYQVRACNCIGRQNGDPVCPCMMPAHMEREAGKQALEILRSMRGKPRVRVKAKSVPA